MYSYKIVLFILIFILTVLNASQCGTEPTIVSPSETAKENRKEKFKKLPGYDSLEGVRNRKIVKLLATKDNGITNYESAKRVADQHILNLAAEKQRRQSIRRNAINQERKEYIERLLSERKMSIQNNMTKNQQLYERRKEQKMRKLLLNNSNQVDTLDHAERLAEMYLEKIKEKNRARKNRYKLSKNLDAKNQ